jgi:signal transduction histidine kinase
MNIMSTPSPVSLEDQLSKKISAWILILVAAIIAALFFISFFLSQQMFNKQVNIWKAVIPQYALTNLMDSDHFSAQREVEFIKSTGLFSSFIVTDNQKRIISQFGSDNIAGKNLVPIQDDAKAVWGYYYFKPDFYRFISPFFIAAVSFLVLILVVYFVIRWRVRSNLESEFSRFNHFLNEIESFTEKLHEIYHEDTEFQIDSKNATAEQIIINKAILRLLNEIKKANQFLREAVSFAEQRRFQEELTRTALQVTHDIGSPLAGLEAIVQSTSLVLPEKERTAIRNAAGRIRDISNTLLQKAQHNLQDNSPLSQQLLQTLVNQVISEKRVQYSQIKIEAKFNESSYGLFAFIRASDFCRVLSNLINNAIEAIDSVGCITISLFSLEKNVIIEIKDNGKGIANDILNKLGKLGVTHGKPQGIGMGLYHAINTIDGWGGKLDIQSEAGQGTTVQIILSITQPPSWFVPAIKIVDNQTIAIIDDDKFIHDLWEEKFKSLENHVHLIHFFSPEEFDGWYEKKKINSSIIYLCDYEFIGSVLNGIDLITKFKINYLSVLVTSRMTYDVINNCEIQNIKLLPKDMVDSIPISLMEHVRHES